MKALKKIATFAVIATMAAGYSSNALAVGPAGMGRAPVEQTGRVVEKEAVIPPFAQILFCAQHPSECRDNQGASVIDLSADDMARLAKINKAVNRSIRGRNDSAGTLGGDLWQVNVRSGDCEDFALTKRSRLMAMGWSSRALRIATARTASGEGHAVLVVKTSQGDLVLDNRFDKIKSVDKTDLRWKTIQSEANPQVWYNL